METIMEKAIQGGYKRHDREDFYMDIRFWHSLGKSCGWRDFFYSYYKANTGREEFNGHWVPVETYLECPKELRLLQEEHPKAQYVRTHPRENPEWKMNALRFHEINLTEGWDKAVEYLSDLIK